MPHVAGLSLALGRIGVRALLLLAYLVIFAPIVTVTIISFFDQDMVSVPPPGLTLKWYANA